MMTDAFDNHELTEVLVSKLMEPEYRRRRMVLDKIVEKNEEIITMRGSLGFIYQGRKFIHTRGQLANSLPMLDYHLCPEMDAYMLDVSMTENTLSSIRQIVFRLLANTQSRQNQRDCLPEPLVGLIDQLKVIPRIDPMEIWFQDDRHKRQYEQIKDQINVFVVARMIY